MGLLRAMFGPSRDEVWRQLAEQLKADFVAGKGFRESKVQVHVDEWTVTLDTYTVTTGSVHITYTRMRAPFVNRDGFRFRIYQKNIFSSVGVLFGMQDIEVGYPDIDREFVLKGNDETKLCMLFTDQRFRELLMELKEFTLEVKDDEGWFGTKFPEGVDELYLQVSGEVKDIERLKRFYELFAVTLHQLCHIGAAYESDPHLNL
jgi:hypothetical protein